MKAKTVNEIQNFERGQDTRKMMGIGNEELRNMNESLQIIKDIFASGFNDDEMNFTKVINHVDSLRNIVDYTLKNHIKKKYGWELKRSDEFGRAFSGINKSSTSRSFTFYYIISQNKFIYPASTSLKTLDKKIDNMIKTYNIIKQV